MNTIDKEVEDISIKETLEEKRSFEEIMKLIEKYPLKNPIKFIYEHSKWELERPLAFPY